MKYFWLLFFTSVFVTLPAIQARGHSERADNIFKIFISLFSNAREEVHHEILDLEYGLVKTLHLSESFLEQAAKSIEVFLEEMKKFIDVDFATAGRLITYSESSRNRLDNILQHDAEYKEIVKIVKGFFGRTLLLLKEYNFDHKIVRPNTKKLQNVGMEMKYLRKWANKHLRELDPETRKHGLMIVQHILERTSARIQACNKEDPSHFVYNEEFEALLYNKLPDTILKVKEACAACIKEWEVEVKDCLKGVVHIAADAFLSIKNNIRSLEMLVQTTLKETAQISCYEEVGRKWHEEVPKAKNEITTLFSVGSFTELGDRGKHIYERFINLFENSGDPTHNEILQLEYRSALILNSAENILESALDEVSKFIENVGKYDTQTFDALDEELKRSYNKVLRFANEVDPTELPIHIRSFYTHVRDLVKQYNLHHVVQHSDNANIEEVLINMRYFRRWATKQLELLDPETRKIGQSIAVSALEKVQEEIKQCDNEVNRGRATLQLPLQDVKKLYHHIITAVTGVENDVTRCVSGSDTKSCVKTILVSSAHAQAKIKRFFRDFKTLRINHIVQNAHHVQCYSGIKEKWLDHLSYAATSLENHIGVKGRGIPILQIFKKLLKISTVHTDILELEYGTVKALHLAEDYLEPVVERIRNSAEDAEETRTDQFDGISNLIAQSNVGQDKLERMLPNDSESKELMKHIRAFFLRVLALVGDYDFVKKVTYSGIEGIGHIIDDMKHFRHWATKHLRKLSPKLYKQGQAALKALLEDTSENLKKCDVTEDDDDANASCTLDFTEIFGRALNKSVSLVKSKVDGCIHGDTDVKDCAKSVVHEAANAFLSIKNHLRRFENLTVEEVINSVHDVHCLKETEIKWNEEMQSTKTLIINSDRNLKPILNDKGAESIVINYNWY